MDHYADDLAAVVEHLDLKKAIHVGHSTGGGEVVRYLARHGQKRAAKAALISAVPPLMVKTEANPLASRKKRSTDCRRSSLPAGPLLSRASRRAVLWLQPTGHEAFGGSHWKLVEAGYDRWGQSAIRRHRGLFTN